MGGDCEQKSKKHKTEQNSHIPFHFSSSLDEFQSLPAAPEPAGCCSVADKKILAWVKKDVFVLT